MTRQRSSSPSAVTRRQFGKQAVTAGLAAAVAGSSIAGLSNASANGENEDGEIAARYQQILRRYGSRLSEAQRQRIKKILAYNEKLLAPIRAFPLENGQPAATILKFYEEADTQVAGTARQTSKKGAEE